MADIWFTADFHLGHANIIRYCDRPFRDIADMDTEIIDRLNSAVSERDFLYFLGDFCRGSSSDALAYLKRIRCKNGIVKLPRVPVADNIPGAEVPVYRNLWENIRKDMPKKGRGKGGRLDPNSLPQKLKMPAAGSSPPYTGPSARKRWCRR